MSVNQFEIENQSKFTLSVTEKEYERKQEKLNNIVNELHDKGILSVFLARKNGNIFRENGLSSEKSAENSKKIKQAYLEIQKANSYDLTNPDEVAEWLNNLTPYLNNSDLNLELYVNSGIPEMDNNIAKMIYEKGAVPTILELLAKNGYNQPRNYETSEDKTQEQLYIITDNMDNHNNIYDMYRQIEEYGCLLEPLKKQIDKQEIVLKTVINSQETQEYLEKIRIRNNNSTFTEGTLPIEDFEELLPKKKFSLSAFIDRIIHKNIVSEPTLTEEETEISNQLNNLSTNNYDAFAYSLRSLKNYINNPEKTLNLADGTNIVETILEKAKTLGYDSTKSNEEILSQATNSNPVLVHYCINQLRDLEEYGCFLSSKCNDIIKDKNFDIDKYTEPQTVEQEKQLPAVRVDMDDLFKQIIVPGVYQTGKETETILDLWKVNKNPTDELIQKLDNQVKALPSTITQKVLLEKWNEYMNKKNNIEPTLDAYQIGNILDELVAKSNILIDKKGIESGMRIAEIQEEIKELEATLANMSTRETTLNNALHTIETIANSEIKTNESYDELYTNLIKQKKDKIESLTTEKQNLVEEKNNNYTRVAQQFVENFKKHQTETKKENNPNLEFEKQAVSYYQNIRKIFEEIESLKSEINKSNVKGHSNTSYDKLDESIIKQEELLTNMKLLIDNIDDRFTMEELDTLKEFYEMTSIGIEIEQKTSEIGRTQIELSQIELNKNNTNTNTVEIIKQKIQKLEQEEKMLSFSPEILKDEIGQMINNRAPKEEVSSKIDELLEKVNEANQIMATDLETEIQTLENKISNDENYIDQARIAFELDKKDIVSKQLTENEKRIEILKSQLDSNNEFDSLQQQRTILLEQQNNYEEERQILLQWSIEESESKQEVRDTLNQLFEESKLNLMSIKSEIEICDERIENLQKSVTSKEEITREINTRLAEQASMKDNLEEIEKNLANKLDGKFIDKVSKLTDIEMLNSKKEELNKLRNNNLESIKEQLLTAYDQITNEPISLPGALVNGNKLNSDGTINEVPELPGQLDNGNTISSNGTVTPTKPLELPGVLENGNILTSSGEIISTTEPSKSLLQKAKEAYKNRGRKILEWIKKHPKISAAVAIAVLAGGLATKALFGGADTNVENTPPVTPEITTETDDLQTEETNEVVQAVDEELNQMEEEKQVPTFEEKYESVVDNILEGNTTVHTSADRAINNQEGIELGGLYTPSFENADVGAIYKQEDGKLIKVSLEEAENIVSNGGQVGVAVENEGTGIGFVSIGGEETTQTNQEVNGISR